MFYLCVQIFRVLSDIILTFFLPGAMPRVSVNRSRGNHRGVATIHDPLLYDEEPMSKDRQKFLIICIFDVSLAVLLWLLSTVTKSDDWPSAFIQEIDIFEAKFLQVSLFDIVIVAFLRTTVLLICFAWLRVNHWLPVAITTGVTTLYISIKALFFFTKTNSQLPPYLMILASFTNAWIELWLLPFRVLAHERRDDESIIETPPTEATAVRSLHSHTTEDEFRSALENSSDEDDDQLGRLPISTLNSFFRLTADIKRQCLDNMTRVEQVAKERILDIPNWKSINNIPEMRYSDTLNSYYCKREFTCSPKGLFLASWKDNAQWNVQVKSTSVLYPLDQKTELVRIVSQPAMNGYIASRDFVDVRKVLTDESGEGYLCLYASVDEAISCLVPAAAGLVRGINGVNVVRITKSEANPANSVFEFVMCTDVKGKIPKMAIRSTTKSFLLGYLNALERHIAQNMNKYE
uniref:START domain-containing protein n=1 Tax=Panagrellus redivivus TaxID=6233 RepID=A0A7E4UVB3_PANRE